MSKVSSVVLLLALSASVAGAATCVSIKQERVPGGALEQTWLPGFGVGRTFTPLTLAAGDPAIPNPTGDNTVAVLQNIDINLGGIAACATDPNGYSDYCWQSDYFTGAATTRVGLILRADPTNGFQTFYQFVLNAGSFVIRFRKFVNGAPVVPDLASWTANVLPGGIPQQNTWHHLRVIAVGNQFDCFYDGFKLNTAPIVDAVSPLLTGWVGAYNFSASVGEVPIYFDNLRLSQPDDADCPTAARTRTWGSLKQMYR